MASPYTRHRQVENLVLVRERDRRRVRELAWTALGVLPLALMLLGYTWLQSEIVRTGYAVRSLERRLEDLSRSERLSRLELSRLATPDRVVAAAISELGLGFQTVDQTTFLEAE
ncbi:MAG: hypothetical protein R3190_04805 [Thermoanaerobaculia bacterium]|nr:hypothetical protein [Thermoanaerobaculia bacterium]